ncbi:MAG: GDYXXLXY domain-containing protein [Elusimicrobiota bacterium]|jgi:uncharacterized membrane-anchored protein
MSRSKWFWLIAGLQVAAVAGMVARKQAVILTGRTITLRTNPVDPHSLFRGDYARLSLAVHRLKADGWTPWPPRVGETVYAELRQDATSWLVVGPYRDFPAGLSADHAALKGKITGHYEINGYKVQDLQDVSSPGWLQTQPSTAPWNMSWTGQGRTPGLWHSRPQGKEGQAVYVFLESYDGKHWNNAEVSESSASHRGSYIRPENQRVLSGRLGAYQSERGLNVEYGIESYFIPEGKGRDYERSGLEAQISVDRSGNSVLRRVSPPQP